ncbi:hypothetical protein NP493_202g00004 [Ridgeia piscesae]|uniref:Uncharacterized protein n=1 Tax=Ridgeia piscesae TaxID=27915 RepID=A0AAD9UEE2_RIDPI|nr:hypothetical protein NP493_202g00004 [Ridgeia piscesae]
MKKSSVKLLAVIEAVAVVIAITVAVVVVVLSVGKDDVDEPSVKSDHVTEKHFDFPSPKTWWAKRISSDLYTAGRLTDRQIKYAADAGFGSIIALINFTDSYDIGPDRVLTTTASRDVAEKVTGITFELLTQTKPQVYTVETVDRASMISLIYMSNTTGLSARDIYRRGALLGYHFAVKTKYVSLITSVTGVPLMADPPRPDVSLPDWNHGYWLIKPVYKNWYVAGQIQANYASNLASMGVGVVVNCRQHATSQEEVALLNVEDNTGTYVGTGRQSTERLLATRIDPARRNEYISPHSTVNYEQENSLEYGDDIGYNATLEKHDMESKNLTYYQTPPRDQKHGMKGVYTKSSIEASLSTWLAAGKAASVCVHSQSGYRAGKHSTNITFTDVLVELIVALVSAARQHGLDSAWAVERASQLGYPFDKEQGQPIVKLFKALLPPKK